MRGKGGNPYPAVQRYSPRQVELSQLPQDSATEPECTDDEEYQRAHQYRESVESLLRSRLELQRIKGSRRSTNGVHKSKQTQANLARNLAVLELFIDPETLTEYRVEGMDLLHWPNYDQENSLSVRLDNI